LKAAFLPKLIGRSPLGGEMLGQAMKTHAERPAFRSFGQTLTYADVDRQSRNFAAYLQKKLGVRRAIVLPS